MSSWALADSHYSVSKYTAEVAKHKKYFYPLNERLQLNDALAAAKTD